MARAEEEPQVPRETTPPEAGEEMQLQAQSARREKERARGTPHPQPRRNLREGGKTLSLGIPSLVVLGTFFFFFVF